MTSSKETTIQYSSGESERSTFITEMDKKNDIIEKDFNEVAVLLNKIIGPSNNLIFDFVDRNSLYKINKKDQAKTIVLGAIHFKEAIGNTKKPENFLVAEFVFDENKKSGNITYTLFIKNPDDNSGKLEEAKDINKEDPGWDPLRNEIIENISSNLNKTLPALAVYILDRINNQ